MFVNGMPFLTTISMNINYHTALCVADHIAPTIATLFGSILKQYKWAGFQVMEVCTNCEFKPVLQVSHNNEGSFKTNLANAQEHVPEAECNNCIHLEHIHTTYHGIPYKMLPQTIIYFMVMETIAKLNYFPAKGGCSNYFSLMEILHHVKLDYKRCTVPCLSSIMFSLMMNQPLPTLFTHMHWIVFSYMPFKQASRV